MDFDQKLFSQEERKGDSPFQDTLFCNLFAGPGTGKSTSRAICFGDMKVSNLNAEEIPEYAKEVTWEKRHHILSFQPYVALKQMKRYWVLRGQCEVVASDSPFLLSCAYARDEETGEYKFTSNEQFDHYLRWMHGQFNMYDILLVRNPNVHPYNPKGRNQTEEQAREKDAEVLNMLNRLEVPHDIVPVLEEDLTGKFISLLIQWRLHGGPWSPRDWTEEANAFANRYRALVKDVMRQTREEAERSILQAVGG